MRKKNEEFLFKKYTVSKGTENIFSDAYNYFIPIFSPEIIFRNCVTGTKIDFSRREK